MATLICHGTVPLNGTNIVYINYGPFTGTPSVTCTVVGSEKNGCNVCIKKRTASGAKLAAFYNGGLMLTEGYIDWIAVGPTAPRACPALNAPCPICRVYE